ncbi:hypothetical protein PG991_000787 [Apiospora marii]|uniref:Uncharacterized protein n=1 Tax=Apiospora marii TaxID=335849 RepID=A0ABR1ST00_9PEZI
MAKLLRQHFNLKGTGPGTYTVSRHNDWTRLPTQPDVLKTHIKFTRACKCTGGDVTIMQIKLGHLTSHLQVQYEQKEQAPGLGAGISGQRPDKARWPIGPHHGGLVPEAPPIAPDTRLRRRRGPQAGPEQATGHHARRDATADAAPYPGGGAPGRGVQHDGDAECRVQTAG